MRTPHLTRSDVVLPAVVAVVGAVEIVAARYDPLSVALATYLVAAAALGLRRQAPLATPVLAAAIYAATPLLGFDVSEPASWVLLLALACFGTGLHTPRPRRFVGLGAVLVTLALTYAGLAWLTDFEPSLLFGTIMTVGAWGLGLALGRALDHERRMGAEAERARLERARAGERAAESERARIAEELHDVLAHAIGAMVVQAAVAGDLMRRDPVAAAEPIARVAQAGREALDETGRLLHLVRSEHVGERGAATTIGRRAHREAEAGRRPRVALRDVALPALFALVACGEAVLHDYGPRWLVLAAHVAAAAVLSLRRRLPLAMPVAVIAVLAGAAAVGPETAEPAATILLLALACFSAGRYVPRRRVGGGLVSVAASVGLVVAAAAVIDRPSADVVFVAAFAVGPWTVGVALREALERTRALAAEAERTLFERKLEAERAAEAERRRIARELHDVLANSLSVMIVQASVAADAAASDPAAAGAAVHEVERSGRAALGEIGRLFRLIRRDSDDAGTHPQHGVADLARLAAEYARAGLDVDLDLDGVRSLPVAVDLSVYRIVQEGLTNALKHAPGSPVSVRLSRRPAEVAIELRNGPAKAHVAARGSGGHGLVGLRERIALFGGRLDARRTEDGGFALTATLPFTETG